MVKCANCDKNADYTQADPGANPVNYCATCLPHWLRERATLGHFPLVEKTVKTKAAPKVTPAESEQLVGIDYEAFNVYYPKSREQERPLNLVDPHLVTRIEAPQAHPIPNKVTYPQGPFPRDVLKEPEIVISKPAFNEDGSEFLPGSTVQNNFKPPKWLRCKVCLKRVLETETEEHVCDE